MTREELERAGWWVSPAGGCAKHKEINDGREITFPAACEVQAFATARAQEAVEDVIETLDIAEENLVAIAGFGAQRDMTGPARELLIRVRAALEKWKPK